MSAFELRPLTEDDAVATSDLSDRVWRAYDAARGRPERPPRSEEDVAVSRRRYAWQAATEPDSSHAAWVAGRLVGVALARRREVLWGLSLLLVDPDVQGGGIGRALLDAALVSAEGATAGMILSSEDPRAMARYRLAGFRLHPSLRAFGWPDRAALPDVSGLREGDAADHAAVDAAGRRLRGAGYGPDMELLAEDARLLIVERGERFGWAFVAGASISQVGGSDPEVARQVLLAALAAAEPGAPGQDARGGDEGVVVRPLTAEQDWAVEAVLGAGLRLEPAGPLCLRGMEPPSPYLPHGLFF